MRQFSELDVTIIPAHELTRYAGSGKVDERIT
jgi:hypothetical protein